MKFEPALYLVPLALVASCSLPGRFAGGYPAESTLSVSHTAGPLNDSINSQSASLIAAAAGLALDLGISALKDFAEEAAANFEVETKASTPAMFGSSKRASTYEIAVMVRADTFAVVRTAQVDAERFPNAIALPARDGQVLAAWSTSASGLGAHLDELGDELLRDPGLIPASSRAPEWIGLAKDAAMGAAFAAAPAEATAGKKTILSFCAIVDSVPVEADRERGYQLALRAYSYPVGMTMVGCASDEKGHLKRLKTILTLTLEAPDGLRESGVDEYSHTAGFQVVPDALRVGQKKWSTPSGESGWITREPDIGAPPQSPLLFCRVQLLETSRLQKTFKRIAKALEDADFDASDLGIE